MTADVTPEAVDHIRGLQCETPARPPVVAVRGERCQSTTLSPEFLHGLLMQPTILGGAAPQTATKRPRLPVVCPLSPYCRSP